jgi:RNA polymerase sigma-70 factor (ECF subfamily)
LLRAWLSPAAGDLRTVSDPILTRVADSDRAALQECIDRHGGLVWSLARRMSSDATDAEDAVQEIFVELWKSADRFKEPTASATTVVAMIARRRLIDRRRRRNRSSDQVGPISAASPRAAAADPDRTTISAEAARAAAAMMQLPPEQQQVLSLSIHHDRTFEQIAEILSMPLGTVKTHARRGLIRLRDLLHPARAAQGGAGAPRGHAPAGDDAVEIIS